MSTDQRLAEGMTRKEILDQVLAAERATQELLAQAARLTSDPAERVLYERLAGQGGAIVRDLVSEEDKLDAEAFVQKAMDV
jgi:hypothetical protein